MANVKEIAISPQAKDLSELKANVEHEQLVKTMKQQHAQKINEKAREWMKETEYPFAMPAIDEMLEPILTSTSIKETGLEIDDYVALIDTVCDNKIPTIYQMDVILGMISRYSAEKADATLAEWREFVKGMAELMNFHISHIKNKIEALNEEFPFVEPKLGNAPSADAIEKE